jgi:hypothetical protein
VDKKLLHTKIVSSKTEVSAAEKHLTKVLRDTQNGPRAEKTTVTESLKEALAKLRAARAELEELDRLLADK